MLEREYIAFGVASRESLRTREIYYDLRLKWHALKSNRPLCTHTLGVSFNNEPMLGSFDNFNPKARA